MLSSLRVRSTCVPWWRFQPTRSHSSSTHDAFKVLFFGRDEFSCLVLQQLLEAKDVWQDIQIVTQPDMKVGRRHSQLSISPLKIMGQASNIPVHNIPHDRKEFRTWKAPSPFSDILDSDSLSQPPVQHLLVTASFGRILSNSLLGLFSPLRRLNVHPSLLPAYRGASPIQHAIMDNCQETGVCVIEMMERKKGIDAGSIWASEKIDVPDGVMFPSLRDSLAVAGGRLLVGVMRDMLAGKDTRVSQPEDSTAPRAPLIGAQQWTIDFCTMSASRIEALHRAISHQRPLTAILKNGRTLQLHGPTILQTLRPELTDKLEGEGQMTYDPHAKALLVRCADNTYISVPKVRQQDRSLLNAKEWWNGVYAELRVRSDSSSPVQFVPPSPTV